jgi:hypothetical protein
MSEPRRNDIERDCLLDICEAAQRWHWDERDRHSVEAYRWDKEWSRVLYGRDPYEEDDDDE